MSGPDNPPRILISGYAFDCDKTVRLGSVASAVFRDGQTRVVAMLDFLMIAYGVGFFVAAILYVFACERM
jgi:hypothetical protein